MENNQVGLGIGDYVWVTRWKDQDPNDPWYVGYIQEIDQGREDFCVKVGNRWWNSWNCKKITGEQGKAILRTYPPLEKQKGLFT